MDGLSEGVSE
uniref:Uncharacterized protein n=1 Tax=Rhizophora mucronata TaxID=61149 RepID=A0A2P2PY45_RHIMU